MKILMEPTINVENLLKDLNNDIFKKYHVNYDFEEENIMNYENIQPKTFSIAEVKELVAKAWEDGYTTSSEDSFHNKNTNYQKSDFYKEFTKKIKD